MEAYARSLGGKNHLLHQARHGARLVQEQRLDPPPVLLLLGQSRELKPQRRHHSPTPHSTTQWRYRGSIAPRATNKHGNAWLGDPFPRALPRMKRALHVSASVAHPHLHYIGEPRCSGELVEQRGTPSRHRRGERHFDLGASRVIFELRGVANAQGERGVSDPHVHGEWELHVCEHDSAPWALHLFKCATPSRALT